MDALVEFCLVHLVLAILEDEFGQIEDGKKSKDNLQNILPTDAEELIQCSRLLFPVN